MFVTNEFFNSNRKYIIIIGIEMSKPISNMRV